METVTSENDAAASTQPTEAPAASEEKKALVDSLFDSLTTQTARGLSLSAGALVNVARWLDGFAKTVSDLATKLTTPAPTKDTTTTEASSSS